MFSYYTRSRGIRWQKVIDMNNFAKEAGNNNPKAALLNLIALIMIKSVVPYYVPLRPKQLLSKTFFLKMLRRRNILMQFLNWDNLYII